MVKQIAGAVKEIFSFFKQQNNVDQKRGRYNVQRRAELKKATNTAEEIFKIVDEMIFIVNYNNIKRKKEFYKLVNSYQRLVKKFNLLD